MKNRIFANISEEVLSQVYLCGRVEEASSLAFGGLCCIGK